MQLVKKFPTFHGTRRFITALTSVRHKLSSGFLFFNYHNDARSNKHQIHSLIILRFVKVEVVMVIINVVMDVISCNPVVVEWTFRRKMLFPISGYVGGEGCRVHTKATHQTSTGSNTNYMHLRDDIMFGRYRQQPDCLDMYITYLLTYLLSPWGIVLLEKLTSFQLVKKFSAFYGT